MGNTMIERQIESVVQDVVSDNVSKLMRGISKVAAMQGGKSTIENYQLLGKRALVVAGVAFTVVQVVTWVGSTVVARRMEKKRIDEAVRRALAEERARQAEAQAEAQAAAQPAA